MRCEGRLKQKLKKKSRIVSSMKYFLFLPGGHFLTKERK